MAHKIVWYVKLNQLITADRSLILKMWTFQSEKSAIKKYDAICDALGLTPRPMKEKCAIDYINNLKVSWYALQVEKKPKEPQQSQDN